MTPAQSARGFGTTLVAWHNGTIMRKEPRKASRESVAVSSLKRRNATKGSNMKNMISISNLIGVLEWPGASFSASIVEETVTFPKLPISCTSEPTMTSEASGASAKLTGTIAKFRIIQLSTKIPVNEFIRNPPT